MSALLTPRLVKWQRLTLGSLVVGYCGYYVCRSNLSIATPLLTQGEGALTLEHIGTLGSVGTLFYAVGKIFSGVFSDAFGGRRMFLAGMLASAGCTVVFGFGAGMTVLIGSWALNRAAQSVGWAAAVKVVSHWFSPAQSGTVGAVLSLSFLFGDALARLFLGSLVSTGLGWRGLFFASAAVLFSIGLAARWTVRDRPEDVGLTLGVETVEPNAVTIARVPLSELLATLIKSKPFWMACVLSLGLTFIRETFNLWTPQLLKDVAHFDVGKAALGSLLFPLAGGISALVVGRLSDSVTKGRRGPIMVPMLVALAASLYALRYAEQLGSAGVMAMLFIASFCLLGPYTFLAGAIALDVGGQKSAATASGLIDSAGYFAGILSGWGIGALAQRAGWSATFTVLAIAALASAAAAAVFGHFEASGELEQR